MLPISSNKGEGHTNSIALHVAPEDGKQRHTAPNAVLELHRNSVLRLFLCSLVSRSFVVVLFCVLACKSTCLCVWVRARARVPARECLRGRALRFHNEKKIQTSPTRDRRKKILKKSKAKYFKHR